MHNKSRLLLVILSMLWASVIHAAQFVASVENNKVSFGQSIQLKLELKDAKAASNLDISALSKDFTIYQSQQYSSYSNTNGQIHSENGWHIVLMPKKVGQFIIPAVSIQTNKGQLSTEPITIDVSNTKSAGGVQEENKGISIVAQVDKAQAYVNEQIVYTVKIISHKPIVNIVLEDIKANNAVIEKIGEPAQYEQNYGGMRAHIIEIKYAITGINEGKVTIEPVTMTGELQVSKAHRYSLFHNSLFDNMFEVKPFSMQSEKITLNILPPPVKTKNWLPLYNFNMKETWDIPQEVRVGDNITRKIRMHGEGCFAKQLPSIKDWQQVNDVKVYANKPSFNDKADNNKMFATKEEEFSFVPQKAGNITFPEVHIKWWNLKTKQLQTVTLPAKTIKVLPVATTAEENVTLDFSKEQPEEIVAVTKDAMQKPIWIYIVITALVTVIIMLIGIIGYLYMRRNKSKQEKPPKVNNKKIEIKTVQDLRDHILQHAMKIWHLPEDITLNRLGDLLTQKNYVYNLEVYQTLSQQLNASLYGSLSLDLTSLVSTWEDFQKSVVIRTTKGLKEKEDEFSTLNPT